jgi:hypothetical protein
MLKILLATAAWSCYDADTCRVNGVAYRMTDYNAPEIHGQCVAERWLAEAARDHLRRLIASSPDATLVEEPCVGNNFGRRCAKITIQGQSIAREMIGGHFAEPYSCNALTGHCQQRKAWCQ